MSMRGIMPTMMCRIIAAIGPKVVFCRKKPISRMMLITTIHPAALMPYDVRTKPVVTPISEGKVRLTCTASENQVARATRASKVFLAEREGTKNTSHGK